MCRLRASVPGVPLVVIDGILCVSCSVQQDRWIGSFLILLLGQVLSVKGGHVSSLSLYGAPALDKSRGSKSVEVQRVWEIYDDRLQFMSWDDAVSLDESLDACDVSCAWLVWSSAAETALADAFSVCWWTTARSGPCPGSGGGGARMRTVRLGGTFKRSIWKRAAGAGEGDDVHLKRDSSAALLLDLRRRLHAVMDVLDGIIRHGGSVARSVELLLQCDRVLHLGPLAPVTLDDYFCCWELVWVSLVGWWVIFIVGCRISFFGLLCILGMLQSRLGGVGSRKILLFNPISRSALTWCPLLHFSSASHVLTPGGSGVLADPVRIDEEFRNVWLPYFCLSGQRETRLEDLNSEVEDWLPLIPEVCLPGLLFGVKVPLRGVWMVGVGGSLRLCLLPGMMGLRVFLPRLRRLVFGLMVCLMLKLP